jgi:hypothetical protein
VIPAAFCWKKGSDFGSIPTGCPSGFFRWGAMCYDECKKKHKFVSGLCVQTGCKSGYKSKGPLCVKKNNIFKTKVKGVYAPKTLTNFSSRIPCPDGKYKSGALCYKDCSKYNMSNCGAGACALSSATCNTSIIGMTVDTAMGAAEFALFVGSFGTSSAAKPGTTAA